MRKTKTIGVLTCLLCGLSAFAPGARASRTLLNQTALSMSAKELKPPPEGQIEGACGVAISPTSGDLYVSDYYHHLVDVFSSAGSYKSQFAVNPSDGVCQLAFSSTGALYANEWHEAVKRLSPSALTYDEAESTGVAVDSTGKVYANDRTHVNVYEPSGALTQTIGANNLKDAYGLAVFAGKVYVPDAATKTIKVFEAAKSLSTPQQEISPPSGFLSLIDAAVAVDPTNGHLLVIDNTQPGYEHPIAAVDEFDGSGAYLGQLPGFPIDGGPSGIAFNPSGTLYLTSGNDEGANVFTYSPYSEGSSGFAAQPGGEQGLAPGAPPQASAAPDAPFRQSEKPPAEPTASASETIQRGKVRVGLNASLSPTKLPRRGTAPIRFSLDATISPTQESIPPQLQRIQIEINRHGQIEPKGLPVCREEDIQPATTQAALEACRGSLVGEGRFQAKVLITQQAPFPSEGKIYAFNGTWKGKPAILAHIYGTKPVPTSSTIPFLISKAAGGTYGAVLEASLPQATSKWGYVTAISMSLGRTFSSHGERHSYLSAGCPAPPGLGQALFDLSRASLSFAGGQKVSSVLSRSCRVR